MRVSAAPCQNTLIIPKRHVSDYFDLHQPERNAIDQLLRDRKQAIEAEDVLRVRGLPLAGQTLGFGDLCWGRLAQALVAIPENRLSLLIVDSSHRDGVARVLLQSPAAHLRRSRTWARGETTGGPCFRCVEPLISTIALLP